MPNEWLEKWGDFVAVVIEGQRVICRKSLYRGLNET